MDAKRLLGRAGKSGQSCCVARARPGRVMPDHSSIPTCDIVMLQVCVVVIVRCCDGTGVVVIVWCSDVGNPGVVCSGHRVCQCGRCVCDAVSAVDTSELCGHYYFTVSILLMLLCSDVGDSGVVCSGHGVCQCGRCVCDAVSAADTTKRYTGELCECNDYICEYYNGQLCGGSTLRSYFVRSATCSVGVNEVVKL